MRAPNSLVAGFVVTFLSCALINAAPRIKVPVVVMADDASQTLFEEALIWSRTHQLETGGCFRIAAISGDRVIVTDAEERVHWRRPDQVSLDCPSHRPIWHTHWAPESGTSVGCNMERAQDLYLIGKEIQLGLVVCGLGRDSVIPYNYSAKADSVHKDLLASDPEIKAEEDSLKKVVEGHRCASEPMESLKRSNVNCKR